ncbi:hypothetical protein BHE74_00047346 [Ensete ventricosum]|uniref:Uncharacterized protein n=1 Tax=Ensete ventricosum TaxID=4639 RepID=A0A444G4B2_ENSVE|nr:hypothetical protein B296_00040151 [Ensete ventricosum]RWW29681.1 hypothetical protein GW17_00005779 [Ensete ventricosum]RWW46706.1 hypothetical protein BHE74_00047346 [Ensete ventricosum]
MGEEDTLTPGRLTPLAPFRLRSVPSRSRPEPSTSSRPCLPLPLLSHHQRKRKRDANPRRQNLRDDEDDDDEDAAAAAEEVEDDGRDSPAILAAADPVLDLRESEVLSGGGHRVSDFPSAVRRSLNRPHSSVLALVAAERSNAARSWAPPCLENISHGQLQVLSVVLPDNPSLLQQPDLDNSSSYVCSPPPLMEGKGVVKRFGKEQLPVPFSDWFSASTVNRLERQVVPHFVTGKSSDQTPERYIGLRNKIISKYLENPGKRLSFADCQALVPNNELYDLSRIVRFLDHWGIINYLAASSVHRGLRMAGSLLREEASGELQLQTSPLRSIDSLMLFDRPKCSLRLEDVGFLSHSASTDYDAGIVDLDGRIRERFAEHSCNFCSCPLTNLHYQSQKEVCFTFYHTGGLLYCVHVAFLTSAIGPRVAAACASAALSVLTREDCRYTSDAISVLVHNHENFLTSNFAADGSDGQVRHVKNGATSPAPDLVKYAAMYGLSAAAVKSKLFADQEEREIQRLAATIINHQVRFQQMLLSVGRKVLWGFDLTSPGIISVQLKRLELKLKQFAEVETLLLKECEQAERMKQRLSAERVRIMSTRIGPTTNNIPSSAGVTTTAPAAVNTNSGQPAVSPLVGQVNMPQAAYDNNLPGHHQMPLVQRQQMFAFGPRLPLSAIHPAPGSSQNVVFNSGIPNSSAPNPHPPLRSSSGNNQT